MIRFAELESLGIAVAAISDVSDGDCGFRGPDPALAAENRKRFCARLGISYDDIVCGCQVHSPNIAWARAEDRGRFHGSAIGALPETDALITDVPGLPLAIFVADCVPVFLYDARKRVVALIHAGREGTVMRIAAQAVEEMRAKSGSNPVDIHAVIGPSAGPCCYEVSEEMAASLADTGFPVKGRHLDLWQANAQQLVDCGLSESNITTSGLCTICTNRFFSHRRDANRSRNMALIRL